MKRIYLIDCPGVVPPNQGDSPEDILLRGVVRVENVENPEQYISAVLKKTKPQHIERTYDIKDFSTHTEFLELLARKGGRLLKGGEADVDGAAKMVLNDFLRGKIPWFTPPPMLEGQEEGKGVHGRHGALGEMGRVGIPAQGDEEGGGPDDADDEDIFEGFDRERGAALEADEAMSDISDEDSLEDGLPPPSGGVSLEKSIDRAIQT